MTFKNKYKRNYATTITRAVGPTTLTGARGTLPQPTPTDANSIWLAKNGNDADPGTQAAPKLTLAGAIAALTDATPNIHIFRNTFIGDLIFSSAANQTIPFDATNPRSLQVEEGETATLSFASGTVLILGGSVTINGVYVSVNNTVLQETIDINGSGNILDNIACINTSNNSISHIVMALGSDTPTINYSIMAKVVVAFAITGTVTVNINNSILYNQLLSNVSNTPLGLIFCTIQNGGTITVNIDRCLCLAFNTFDGSSDAIVIFATSGTSAARTINLNITNSMIAGNGKVLLSNASDAAAIIAFNYTTNYVKADITPGFDVSAFPCIITEIDAISNTINQAALLVNYQGFIDDPVTNIYSSSLQARGKATPDGSGRYFLNSPLIGAGLAAVDVNPWDESTVLTSEGFDSEVSLYWPPKDMKVDFKLINRAKIYDVNGNPHSAYDAMRKLFSFVFNSYTGNENIWKMVKLMMDKGSLALYPKGIGNTLFSSSATGSFNATTGVFSPVLADPMVEHHWSGFWITISGEDFYISDNTETTFTLIDKLGLVFPATGAYSFTIEYILVQPDMESVQAVQEFYTRWRLGGDWTEKDDTETAAFEFNGLAAVFEETENLEEDA